MLKKLSPKTKRNIARILPFGVIWFLFSQIFFISDYAAVGDMDNLPETAIRLEPGIYFFAAIAVTVLGLVIGAIELTYLNRRLSTTSLAWTIVFKTLFYTTLILIVIIITFPIAASMEMDTSILDRQVWDKLLSFFGSKTFLSTLVQSGVSLGASLFYSEINEHLGPGVLTNFLTGKYHTPKEETRVFMFTDMKSSTRIAEEIGHSRYFELLRAYYADLSDSIVNHGGVIYQYVGDEVIVSWPAEEGIKDQNCIACFFAMKHDLSKKAKWYQDRFGVVPDFKAGLHVGPVTTGEIGALKKEIIFTGDVLNATARIQGLCNQYKVDLLISGELLKSLGAQRLYEVLPLGRCILRGKTQTFKLFTLRPQNGQDSSVLAEGVLV